jgi:hypothetical protein
VFNDELHVRCMNTAEPGTRVLTDPWRVQNANWVGFWPRLHFREHWHRVLLYHCFSDAMQCTLVNIHRRSGWSYCPHLRYIKVSPMWRNTDVWRGRSGDGGVRRMMWRIFGPLKRLLYRAGGSTFTWNVGKHLPGHTTTFFGRQLLLWDLQTSLYEHDDYWVGSLSGKALIPYSNFIHGTCYPYWVIS